MKNVYAMKYGDMIDHHSYTLNRINKQLQIKLKPEKNSGLNGIQTHDLCNTSTKFSDCQLSYEVNWELVTL